MEFKLDENLPELLVTELALLGHDATTCADEGIAGERDSIVAARAVAESRILATFDLDFADILQYPPGSHPGIIVFRLHSQDTPTCVAAFQRLLLQCPEDDIHGNLLIVEESRVRVRRPSGP